MGGGTGMVMRFFSQQLDIFCFFVAVPRLLFVNFSTSPQTADSTSSGASCFLLLVPFTSTSPNHITAVDNLFGYPAGVSLVVFRKKLHVSFTPLLSLLYILSYVSLLIHFPK